MLKSRIFIRCIIEVATENIKGCSKAKSAFYFDDCSYLLLSEGTSWVLYKFLSVATVRLQCILPALCVWVLVFTHSKGKENTPKQKINTRRNIYTTDIILALFSWKQMNRILCKKWAFQSQMVLYWTYFCDNLHTVLGQNFLEILGGKKNVINVKRENLNFYLYLDLNLQK